MMYPLCLEATPQLCMQAWAQLRSVPTDDVPDSTLKYTQASPDSSPLPMNDSERHWNASLREMRSFLMELMMSRRNSSFCRAGAGA